jgi:hypothetical protein
MVAGAMARKGASMEQKPTPHPQPNGRLERPA